MVNKKCWGTSTRGLYWVGCSCLHRKNSQGVHDINTRFSRLYRPLTIATAAEQIPQRATTLGTWVAEDHGPLHIRADMHRIFPPAAQVAREILCWPASMTPTPGSTSPPSYHSWRPLTPGWPPHGRCEKIGRLASASKRSKLARRTWWSSASCTRIAGYTRRTRPRR